MKYIALVIIGLVLVPDLRGQVGEIKTGEVILEKDKEIILPKADKLFLPVGSAKLRSDTSKINFTIPSPNFKVPILNPLIEPESYGRAQYRREYQNYLKAGFGNFVSPLVSAYVGEQNKKIEWGAWLFHESFARGAVDGKSSASGKTSVDFFSTFQNKEWSATPSVAIRDDFFRYYGNGEGRADKSNVTSYRLDADLQRIEITNWNFRLNPSYEFTTHSIEGENVNKESHFLIDLEGGYAIDSSYQINSVIQSGLLTYNTGGLEQQRNYFRFNPWLNINWDDFKFHLGVVLASTTDTVESNGFFYPQIGVTWAGIENWNVYGEISGDFRPVTFREITAINGFLDDSLGILHESIQSRLNGGIRGRLVGNLFVDVGVDVSSIDNMGFFTPSPADSSRFVYTLDGGATTRFELYGKLNWNPVAGTAIRVETRVLDYATETLLEPWHRPTFTFQLQWNQVYSEKFSTELRISNMSGIRAPRPITGESVRLDPIVDIGVNATYKVSDQLAAFLEIDNLYGQEYERFLNYPIRGTSLKIGALYRF